MSGWPSTQRTPEPQNLQRTHRCGGKPTCPKGSTDFDAEGLGKSWPGCRPHVGGAAREGHLRQAVIEEMTAAGAFVFSDGGLDASTVVCSVDPSSGSPLFTDGPFVETKEHLGGFAVVDVPDDAKARYWAGRIAVAVGWPQEVHRFPHRIALSIERSRRPCRDWDVLMGMA